MSPSGVHSAGREERVMRTGQHANTASVQGTHEAVAVRAQREIAPRAFW